MHTIGDPECPECAAGLPRYNIDRACCRARYRFDHKRLGERADLLARFEANTGILILLNVPHEPAAK